MAKTPRGKLFDDMEPSLGLPEIKSALDENRIALSFHGKPMTDPDGTIKFLAVKLALANGSFSTVLLDRFSASALKALIDGADQINWDGKSMLPNSTKH